MGEKISKCWNDVRGLVRIGAVTLLTVIVVACASKQNPETEILEYEVIIVGAGLGGLTAGLQLADAGLRVVVLEQRNKVGGCASSFSRGEFNFDAALHQLSIGGGKGKVLEILRDLKVLDRIELIRTKELARSIFPGIDFTTPTDKSRAIAILKARWPDEANEIDRFYQLAAAISREMLSLSDLYKRNWLSTFLTKLVIPFRQPHLFKWRNATLSEVLDEYFDSPELKAVISQYWVYFGPPPSKVWAPMFLTAYYSYFQNGAWQIRGSAQSLSNALADRIVELGGDVRTGKRVAKIQVERGAVTGIVTADGELLRSRYVVSNADPFQTFLELIGEEKSPAEIIEKVRRLKPSNSLVGVYLGLDVEPSHFGIDTYEIFYNTSLDSDLMYKDMLEGRFTEGALTITIYSNIGDDFYAPAGKSVVVLNAYSGLEYWPKPGPEYLAKKKDMEEQLIRLAENVLPGLRQHILVREGMTPYTIKSYTGQNGGVPYGWNMVPKHFERLANDTPINGLYLAGSWAGMIHGVSGAILSGERAAQFVLDKERMDQKHR